jgi:hypothetical protein
MWMLILKIMPNNLTLGNAAKHSPLRMNMNLLKPIALIISLIFASCSFFNPSTAEDKVNIPIQTKDSVYAWNRILVDSLPTDKEPDANLIVFRNTLYYRAIDGSIMVREGSNWTKLNAPKVRSLSADTAFGSLWYSDFAKNIIVRIDEQGNVHTNDGPPDSLATNKGWDYSFFGGMVGRFKNTLIMMSNSHNPSGACSDIKVNCKEWPNGNWNDCSQGYKHRDVITCDPFPSKGIQIGDLFVLGTYYDGLYKFDGQKWDTIPYANLEGPFNSSLPKAYRSKPIIHNGRAYFPEWGGGILETSDGIQFKVLTRSLVRGALPKDTLFYPYFDAQAEGLVSYQGELYNGSAISRRNFRDSIWLPIVPKEDSLYVYKERKSPMGGEYDNGRPPGKPSSCAGLNDSLFCTIFSSDAEFYGIWALDLKQMRNDTAWLAQRRRPQ